MSTDTCNICGRLRELVQDHDHVTGLCRPRLCNRCNVALGWYERNAGAIREHLDGPQGEPYVDVLRRRNAARMRRVNANLREQGVKPTPAQRARNAGRQRAHRARKGNKGVTT